MEITDLRDIKPLKDDMKIRVRICRIWRGKQLYPVVHNDGLQCVLVDHQNDAIHALTKEIDYEVVSTRIKVGQTYDITHFYTRPSQESYIVVPHLAQIWFNVRTIFTQIEDIFPQIPQHRFYLMDYNNLLHRFRNNEILTDVLGHIKSIQPVQEISVQNRMDSKCDVYIQNIRKEDMKVSLWGDVARNFPTEFISQLESPVLVVFTSMIVKIFGRTTLNSSFSTCTFINPDIPETTPYKTNFFQAFHAPKILAAPSKQPMEPDEIEAVNKKTVKELNIIDPKQYKDEAIYCRASITDFIIRYGWYYQACPTCTKQLKQKPESDLLICENHSIQLPKFSFKLELLLEDASDTTTVLLIGKPGEDLFGISCEDLVIQKGHTDQTILPPEILKIKGQIRVLQLKIGFKDNLIIKRVYPDFQLSTKRTHQQSVAADSTHRELFKSEPDKKQKKDSLQPHVKQD